MMEGTDFYLDEDEDVSCKHKFETWRARSTAQVLVFMARHDWSLL
jgi:hypothetical protein